MFKRLFNVAIYKLTLHQFSIFDLLIAICALVALLGFSSIFGFIAILLFGFCLSTVLDCVDSVRKQEADDTDDDEYFS